MPSDEENKEPMRKNHVEEDISLSTGLNGAEAVAQQFASLEITNMDDNDTNSDLWKPHPPTVDCLICFVPLPLMASFHTYCFSCGKISCSACFEEHKRSLNILNAKRAKKELPELEKSCPFCRVPIERESDSEIIAGLEDGVLRGDVVAIEDLADNYMEGGLGLNKEVAKALKLYHVAADLGSAYCHTKLAFFYSQGKHGIKVDTKRAKMHAKVAVKRNDPEARWILADLEAEEALAMRHCRLGAAAGNKLIMDNVWKMFYNGKMSKDDLEDTLRKYHDSCKGMNSEERERYRNARRAAEGDDPVLHSIYMKYYRGEVNAKLLKMAVKNWQNDSVLLEPFHE